MSMTQDVTRGYASFFLECGKFAVSPYTGTFFGIAKPSSSRQEPNFVAAALITGILTFVIPVLPALFSLTCAIASVAVSLAVASMFLLYPIALLTDAFEPSRGPSVFA